MSDCVNDKPFGAQFEAMVWLLVPRKQYDQLKAQRDALKWLALRLMARAGTVVLLHQGRSEATQEAVEGLQELISQAAELFERIEKEGPA